MEIIKQILSFTNIRRINQKKKREIIRERENEID